ncbi:MAG: thiazole synthase [Candidatus Margulisbacteria bacterium GWF2_35_9]|nr:MAG: thiazole synthase [Candidatus Margulisbacteria bacterium GWF2_35_9]
MKNTEILTIAGKEFHSRLFTGTGKFASPKLMKDALTASGTEMVTVALRRVDLKNPEDHILNHLDRTLFHLLPNTSGAANAEEAVRLARLSLASSLSNWIKLEVTPEPRYLLPDGEETLKAAKILIKEGFIVLPYIQADPLLARKLEDIGTATVMPLASPIGSNKGIKNIDLIKIIIEQANIPVVIDAGLGKPSDAAYAMELGADAVLVNTAIATASNPKNMGEAFKLATIAGRIAYLSGLSNTSDIANASSPLDWLS